MELSEREKKPSAVLKDKREKKRKMKPHSLLLYLYLTLEGRNTSPMNPTNLAVWERGRERKSEWIRVYAEFVIP